MNDRNTNDQPGTPAETPRKKSKKGLFLVGGTVGLVAFAYAASLMAIPAKPDYQVYEGPFVASLLERNIQVNLAGGGSKNFLSMTLKVEFDAYSEGDVRERLADPLYQAMLTDSIITVASQRTKSDVVDAVGKEALKRELLERVDPLLFPVHIGDADRPGAFDSKSGLRLSSDMTRQDLSGPLCDHTIHVDGDRQTIHFDDGEAFDLTTAGAEVVLANTRGDRVRLDVRGLKPGFGGDVQVGVHGQVRGLYLGQFLVQ